LLNKKVLIKKKKVKTKNYPFIIIVNCIGYQIFLWAKVLKDEIDFQTQYKQEIEALYSSQQYKKSYIKKKYIIHQFKSGGDPKQQQKTQ